jgi:hypothetical protein
MHSDGKHLYVAIGTPAEIYKIDKQGKAQLYHKPDANFVWAMDSGPNNAILCASGDPGSLFSLKGEQSKILFASEERHLRSLKYDAKLGIFAGGGEKGILYRQAPKDKDFRALFDSGHTEVTSIVVQDDVVYAASVTGADALLKEQKTKRSAKSSDIASPSISVRSQLVRVDMYGASEILAGSNDEVIFAMTVNKQGHIIVATGATGREDPRGRIYTVEPKTRRIAMLYQSDAKRITHLIHGPRGMHYGITGNGTSIFKLQSTLRKEGYFYSEPFDTQIHSRFGHIEVFGLWPSGTKVLVATRSGQSKIPDTTWSNWSDDIRAPGKEVSNLHPGRYLQVRLTLSGNEKVSPEVHRVRLAYLRQNLPPFIRKVSSLQKGIALVAIPPMEKKGLPLGLGDKSSKDKSSESKALPGKGPNKTRRVNRNGAMTIKWEAEDPNADQLTYKLSFRKSSQKEWTLMKENLIDSFHTIYSSQLPDGHYQFRIEAHDGKSNPKDKTLKDSRDSRFILVDNTPPKVDKPSVKFSKGRVSVHTNVLDGLGPITTAEYAIDGQTFIPLVPDDGILDSNEEAFTTQLDDLREGVHVFTIRVIDEGHNQGFGETQFTVND